MKNSERNASARTIRFVLAIFGIAVLITAIYLVLLMPREPQEGQTPPHAINQSTP
jgi:phage shock protein PspC (stress-responsive transcriptional regulator)